MRVVGFGLDADELFGRDLWQTLRQRFAHDSRVARPGVVARLADQLDVLCQVLLLASEI